MPVYTVTTAMGRLDQQQKHRLAAGITAIHGEETGVPEPLIHVIFQAYPKCAAWSAAQPGAPTVVQGSLRAGRSEEIRARMLHRINNLVCEVMQITARDVQIGLFDIPPHWVMESGMIDDDPAGPRSGPER